MEKLLCSGDIMGIFGCKRDKALELMREMNPINLNRKPGSKKPNLRVRESDLNAWVSANRGLINAPHPEQPAPRGRKPRPVYIPPAPRGQIPHRIPRRQPENTRQTKSPGDVAASARADHKDHEQYITRESEAQAQNA